jgi:Zn-dependent peptidase ImmA (M78 family)
MNTEMIALWHTLSPDACLSTAELAKGFGVSAEAIRKRVKAGSLPPPKYLGGKMHAAKGWSSIGNCGRPMMQKSKWRVGDILKSIDSRTPKDRGIK